MIAKVKFQSSKKGELNKFLSEFYNTNLDITEQTYWEKEYKNPIEISDIIGAFIDNIDNFDLKLWICLDKDIYININENNANNIIRYLFERYPY
ncbi:MAG: hypothetical protein HFJ17_01305 [Clostridia bacterium]|nr:hypothetical protein [Clostridia bacterium]